MGEKIPNEVASDILAKCCRCCCLCRRFRPTCLQVHHIIEQSKGGTNDPDNLTAICLHCHSDVHTKRPFSRRFTPEELRQHRDAVFALVRIGNLVPPEDDDSICARYEGIELTAIVNEGGIPDLSAEAVDVLIAASESTGGQILMTDTFSGLTIAMDGHTIQTRDPRDNARYRKAMEFLEETELLDDCGHKGEVFRITHDGYLLADQLLALRARNAEE